MSGKKYWLSEKHYLPWAACLGRSAGCLRSTILPRAACLGGRSTDHLGISAHCLRTNYLWGRSAGWLRGADCLGSTVFSGIKWLEERGAGHLRISALCLGRVRTNCLSINCLGGRGASCLRSTVFLGTTCLGRADCMYKYYIIL